MTLADMKGGAIEKGKILWVKTITTPCLIGIAAIMTMVEDKNHHPISFLMYNQVKTTTTVIELQSMFPKGIDIGIKQPYKKLPYNGNLTLRNDN